ncbi:hypothetical protein DVH24_040990 [Malus domestica]|uniref:Uncharacterized protein n=1 Tax=Malus domestica TaxID=3750 RepID=A0A498IF35_MALDO|nr:hypothetical protein DVH24_040990 [Malus domestica]
MKLIQVSAARSRASLYFIHGGVTSRTPKPRPASSAAPKVGTFSRSRLSVCGFCRTRQRNKVAMDGIVRSATSNAYCSMFCRSHHKAVALLSSRKIWFRKEILRPFSTCTEPLISPISPLIIRLAIVKSLKLASESKLLCREIAVKNFPPFLSGTSAYARSIMKKQHWIKISKLTLLNKLPKLCR